MLRPVEVRQYLLPAKAINTCTAVPTVVNTCHGRARSVAPRP
jgi:hypothetical protein